MVYSLCSNPLCLNQMMFQIYYLKTLEKLPLPLYRNVFVMDYFSCQYFEMSQLILQEIYIILRCLKTTITPTIRRTMKARIPSQASLKPPKGSSTFIP